MNDLELTPRTPAQRRWTLEVLRDETTGGFLLVVATVLALIMANSQLHDWYEHLIHVSFGFGSFQLPVHAWVADFLLAIFFFVVGIELRYEFTQGSLTNMRLASVPISGALGGMFTSALIFLFINRQSDYQSAWAIPISTDVAFALAVLALAGRRLPLELRSFLLTLAVVNDLGAISVIAIFYSADFHASWFILSLVEIAIFTLLQQKFAVHWIISLGIAIATWVAMYESGVHATVAGVLLGLAMRSTTRAHEEYSPAHRIENVLRPFSATVCVPLFAFVSAGLAINSSSAGDAMQSPLVWGIIAGLVLGQPIGVTAFSFIAAKVNGIQLPKPLTWWDIAVVGTLASVGFTVALLVADMSLVNDHDLDIAKFGLLVTLLSAVAVSVTAIRMRHWTLGRKQKPIA